MRRLLLAVAASLAIAGRAASAQSAQVIPIKPVHLISPYPPGGTSDNLARLLAEKLRTALGQPVVIENKPGGTSSLGAAHVAQAQPDGYTLLLGPMTAFTVLPHLRKLPYDPVTSFEPISTVATYLAVVTVRNDMPVRTFGDLVALARKQPGKLSYGSSGVASFGNMAGETIKLRQSIDMLHVPFKGSNDLVPGLLGGHIDLFIDGVGLGAVKSGKARALAVFADQRHPELPDVPTIAEAGLKTHCRASGGGCSRPRARRRRS